MHRLVEPVERAVCAALIHHASGTLMSDICSIQWQPTCVVQSRILRMLMSIGAKLGQIINWAVYTSQREKEWNAAKEENMSEQDFFKRFNCLVLALPHAADFHSRSL